MIRLGQSNLRMTTQTQFLHGQFALQGVTLNFGSYYQDRLI